MKVVVRLDPKLDPARILEEERPAARRARRAAFARGLIRWTAVMLLAAALLPPFPPLRAFWIGLLPALRLGPIGREWAEYCSYASELLLLVLFGEATYTRWLANLIERICKQTEQMLAAQLGSSDAADEQLREILTSVALPGSERAFDLQLLRATFRALGVLTRTGPEYSFLPIVTIVTILQIVSNMLIVAIARIMPGGITACWRSCWRSVTSVPAR